MMDNKCEILEKYNKTDDFKSNSICDGNLDFVIEVEADELENETNTEKNETTSDVPLYESEFTGFLATKEYSMLTGKHIKNDARPKKICFNCRGDHNINDCKEEKNFKEIARNRQAILGRRNAQVRYHEESENKYGHFKPGEISDNLKFALDLGSNEAPEFIYRMRILGYPPGWLKEAEVRRSDVSLFDSAGKAMSHPEDEEGETDISLIKYEPEKLISFPGFNVPFPKSFRDDHRYYNCPNMQRHHRKEEFERFMKMNKVSKYKKKKLSLTSEPTIEPTVSTAHDMEIENSELNLSQKIEFNPPLPTEDLPPPPPTSLPPEMDKEEGEVSDNSNDSNEMKLTRKGTMPNISDSFNENNNSNSDKLSDNALTPSLIASEDSTSSPGIDDSLNSTPQTMVKRHHRSRSKGFSLGVSIPENISPYRNLPKPEKWTVDVSDHILFDNLPDALGTWKKMKGIVNNVRQHMDVLHADDDDE